MIKRTILMVFLLITSTAAGEAAEENQSLCSPDEVIVFSCVCSNKVLSLCATNNITANTGRLTYRYGIPVKTLELVYPAKPLEPAKAFYAYFDSWAKGSVSEISFKRGQYTYTVYSRTAAFEIGTAKRENGAGVEIHRKEALVQDIWCKDSTIQDNIWRVLRNIGLPGLAEMER